jgi:hypothetical protein
MDTAFEAMMRAMLNGGWFTRSGGDVESSTGYFGYCINEKKDLFELRQTFQEVINAYGDPFDEELIGNFYASINSQGGIYIYREKTPELAKEAFEIMESVWEMENKND